MSTVKISELPVIPVLNSDTTQTLFPAVDVSTDITGQLTAKVLAASLYSNDVLNVGNTAVILPNVVAQLASSSDNYIQVNLQNSSGNGSADYVITADTGDDATYYIDMGYNGSTYSFDGYTYAKPLDGYLIVQGADNLSPGGNLVIGTTTAGKDISILVGSIDESKIMSKFVANTGFKMLEYPVIFADGTTQNTAASSTTHSEVIFGKANAVYSSSNTVGTYANSAFGKANAAMIQANNAWTKANTANETAVSGVVASEVADGKATSAFLVANTAWTKANNALANTTGTFAGDLTLTGNLIARGIQTTTGPITTGNLIVDGTSTVSGNTNLSGILNVTGAVNMNATLVLANSNFSATESAVTIKATANVATPSNDGYMLHISGKQNIPSRIVFDSYSTTGNAYGLVAGRSARGTVDAPTASQDGDVLMRISGNGYGTTGYAPLGVARIDIVATENYTDSARGSQIKFYNTVPGTNTINQIATFNGSEAVFTGIVNPQKGLKLTPNVLSGIVTTLNIDIANNSLYYFKTNATTTINLSGYESGKIVEVWLTNTDNNNHTVTHGCLANNSTTGSASFTVTSGHSAFLKYFSIDGDQANTYVSVNYS